MTAQINFVIVIVIYMVSFSFSSSVNSSNTARCNETSSYKCGRGNEKTKSTCIPKCPEFDNHTESEICNYTKNDGGDSCNDTRYCLVAPSNSYCDINQQSISGVKTRSATQKANKSQEFQKCCSKCDAQGKVTMLFNITRLENTCYCWTVIHSPCNASEINYYWKFFLDHQYPIGGTAIGIIALLMVVCICCIVRRKKKPISPKENIPLRSKYPEYMEDNSIYS